MAATLLHLTSVELLLGRQRLPAPFDEAFAACPWAARLGAAAVDLPYYAHFPVQVARHLLERPPLPSRWGDRFHFEAPGRLALALVEATSRVEREERPAALAFLGGHLSHMALDIVQHPLVHDLVERDLAEGDRRHPAVLHQRCERWQSAFARAHFHGEDAVGKLRMLTRFHLLPPPFPILRGLGGLFPGPLRRLLIRACRQTYGSAPHALELADWVRGLTEYGLLVSTPLGRSEGLGDRPGRPERRRYFEDAEAGLHFLDVLAASLDRALSYLEAASEYLAGRAGDARTARRRFALRVPDRDLTDGRDPRGCSHPGGARRGA